MNVVSQEIVVGVLVACCALFSVWRLASVRARLWMLQALHGLAPLRRVAWLTRLRERTLARSTAACGGCSQPGGAARGGSDGRSGVVATASGATRDEASPN